MPLRADAIAPSRRQLAAIAALAFVARAVMVLVAMRAGHFSADRIASMRDGSSYLAYAGAVERGPGGFAALPAYDRRVFPGFPLLIAGIDSAGLPLPGAVFVLNWLAAAAAAALSALLYRDWRIGVCVAMLTPSYLMYSSVIMTEPTVLLSLVAALLLATRGRPLAGGLLQGAALAIRPFAFVAGAAYAVESRRRPRDLLLYAAGAAIVLAATLLFMRWWSGSFFPGMQVYANDPRAAYHGEIFTWPFKSLLTTPAPLWKTAYIWLHVAISFAGCVWLWRDREWTAATWLTANTLTIVCIGGIYGFHEFHRFMVPALPPLFFAFRRWLPRTPLLWVPLGAASFAFAFVGLKHAW